MTDWADGMEPHNYGIRCVTDSHHMWELLGTIVSLAMIAGALLFYSWIRSQIVNMGYESQRLFTLEQSQRRTEANLILVEETLKSPERIDTIARKALGMAPLRPSQLIPLQNHDMEVGIPNAVAMADSETMDPKKPAAGENFGIYPTD